MPTMGNWRLSSSEEVSLGEEAGSFPLLAVFACFFMAVDHISFPLNILIDILYTLKISLNMLWFCQILRPSILFYDLPASFLDDPTPRYITAIYEFNRYSVIGRLFALSKKDSGHIAQECSCEALSIFGRRYMKQRGLNQHNRYEKGEFMSSGCPATNNHDGNNFERRFYEKV